MKIANNTKAIDFTGITVERNPFLLNRLKGKKIILSFFRNGSCALSNYRLHQLMQYRELFLKRQIELVCVFESMPKDIFPYTGISKEPFSILADPMGLLYDLYKVENADDCLREMITSGLFAQAIKSAAQADFAWAPQPGTNFFRMYATFLIDEDFTIYKSHYSKTISDHLSIDRILAWINYKPATIINLSPKVVMPFKQIQ